MPGTASVALLMCFTVGVKSAVGGFVKKHRIPHLTEDGFHPGISLG